MRIPHFSKQVFFFVLPFLILGVLTEYGLRKMPNDYRFKKEILDSTAGNIEVLALGSSHAYYGVNPQYVESFKAFNGAHISQTIDLDLELYKAYQDQYSELKWLLIPIDYSSLFSRLRTGNGAWRIKNYLLYYDLDLEAPVKHHTEVLSVSYGKSAQRLFAYHVKNEGGITCNELGYGTVKRKRKNLERTGRLAAERHTKHDWSNLNPNKKVLEEFIALAEENGVQILFYTSPAHVEYIKHLKPIQLDECLKTMEKYSNDHPHVFYINYLDDSRFSDEDFMDADHLSPSGAEKFTRMINERIMSFEKGK